MKKILSIFLAVFCASLMARAQNINFSDTAPAPPSGSAAVKWQHDASTPANISAYVSSGAPKCSDTSGSGTAQSCSTVMSMTPAAGSCVTYLTTTANSGTALTVNINSLGAKSVAIPSSSGWTTTLVAGSSIPANKPMLLCYDGTVWDASGTGFASTGGAAAPTVTISTSGPVTVAGTGSGFWYNNAAGAIPFNLPTITSGMLGNLFFCFRNYTGKTGAITLQSPSATYIDLNGATASAAGTLVSGGALGDSVCVVPVTTTLYMAYVGVGTWTNN